MTTPTVTLTYDLLLVTFDLAVYQDLVALTGWTVKTSQNNYKSVRATKQPYVGQKLSRIITDCPADLVVDHINGNSLDNRLANLRVVTRSQNQYNKVVWASKKSGLPKGVYYNKKLNNFYAQITQEGRRIHLGSFMSCDQAEEAYIKAAARYHSIHAVHTSRS